MKNKLEPADIEAAIASARYIHPDIAKGETLTVCILTLQNGFNVVGTSACVDPANYDQALGESIARKKAAEQIWQLEGYLLRQRLYDAATS